jgi:hypothetical protein
VVPAIEEAPSKYIDGYEPLMLFAKRTGLPLAVPLFPLPDLYLHAVIGDVPVIVEESAASNQS